MLRNRTQALSSLSAYLSLLLKLLLLSCPLLFFFFELCIRHYKSFAACFPHIKNIDGKRKPRVTSTGNIWPHQELKWHQLQVLHSAPWTGDTNTGKTHIENEIFFSETHGKWSMCIACNYCCYWHIVIYLYVSTFQMAIRGWLPGLSDLISCPILSPGFFPSQVSKACFSPFPQGNPSHFGWNKKSGLSSVCTLCVFMSNIHEYTQPLLQNQLFSLVLNIALCKPGAVWNGYRGSEPCRSASLPELEAGGAECGPITQLFSTPQHWWERSSWVLECMLAVGSQRRYPKSLARNKRNRVRQPPWCSEI